MRLLNVLHICNNYYGTSVYIDLVNELNNNNIGNYVLVVLPNNKNYLSTIDINKSTKNLDTIIIPNIVNNLSKFFPIIRVLFLFQLVKKYKKVNIDIIHSHTLYSNGSMGRWLSNILAIPHISSIRNVDINTVYKNLIYYRKSFLKKIAIGNNVFPNKAYVNFVTNEMEKKNINMKSINISIIPNSVDHFWLENKYQAKQVKENVVTILFVGEFTSNKNIDFLLDVFATQWLENIKFEVKIIGYLNSKWKGNQKYYEHIQSRVENIDNIKMLDKVTEKEVLLEHYRNSDIFFMTSFYETFGLVYVEAMSQGLPIIYTRGQGIDGFYQEGDIGFPVDPTNVEQARSCIESVIDNYQKISQNCVSFVDDFSKEVNINKLINIYKDARDNK
jgi:glycosyltransferase involved in cell wall biosynthesis